MDLVVLALWAIAETDIGQEEAIGGIEEQFLERELTPPTLSWADVWVLKDKGRFVFDSERSSDQGDILDGLNRYGAAWAKAALRKDIQKAITAGCTQPVLRQEQGYTALVMVEPLPRHEPPVLDLQLVDIAAAEQFIDETVDFYTED